MLFLKDRLRAADRRELQALGRNPGDSLADGFDKSKPHAFTLDRRGHPVAIFGCVPVPAPVRFGSVWMLATDELREVRFSFLRHSRRWLQRITQDCRVSGNLVDSRNTLHVRWILWLGYRFLRRVQVGSVEFWEFAKIHV